MVLLIHNKIDTDYQKLGLPEFNKASQKLVFGPLVNTKHIVTTQALSGTGALRVGIEFLHKQVLPNATLYVSDPTWGTFPSKFS
jgi:aspartate/tyrosine/aromatic aminotransferase